MNAVIWKMLMFLTKLHIPWLCHRLRKERDPFKEKKSSVSTCFCTIFVYYQVNAYIFSITERMDTTSRWILPFPAREEGRWWSDSCQDAGWTDHRVRQGARDDCVVSFRSSIHYHSWTVTLTDLWLW